MRLFKIVSLMAAATSATWELEIHENKIAHELDSIYHDGKEIYKSKAF